MVNITESGKTKEPLDLIKNIIKSLGYSGEIQVRLDENILTIIFPYILEDEKRINYAELRITLLKALEDNGYGSYDVRVIEEKIFSDEQLN